MRNASDSEHTWSGVIYKVTQETLREPGRMQVTSQKTDIKDRAINCLLTWRKLQREFRHAAYVDACRLAYGSLYDPRNA